MERFLLVTVIVCCCFLRQSTGLDFTLDRDVGQDFDGGAVCGVLLCVEESHTSTNISTSADQSETGASPDDVSTISSLTIYRTDGPQCTSNTEHKQKTVMAAVTSQQRDILDVTSEDITVDGYLNAGHAELRLVMVKQEDCQAEFTCQVRAVDIQGRHVEKTSYLLHQGGEGRHQAGSWTSAEALNILSLAQHMDTRLSMIGQSVLYVEDGLKRLEKKIGRSKERVGRVESQVGLLDSVKDRLMDRFNTSSTDGSNNQTKTLDSTKPARNDTVLTTMLSSFDSKIAEMNVVLSTANNNLQSNTSHCLSTVKNGIEDLVGKGPIILNNTNQNTHKSFDNFIKDLTEHMDSDLDSLENKLGSKVQEVFVIVNSSATKINSMLDDSTPVAETCQKGMTPILSKDSSYNAVFDSSQLDSIESPFLCDTMTDGGGWVVIQRRINGDVDFNRDWATYKKGFGCLAGDFWLGNDNIHKITSSGTYELRVEVKEKRKSGFAHYSTFYVGDEQSNYVLQIGSYDGTAGDCLFYHDGMKFTTFDNDHDLGTYTNCALQYSGGWWYKECYFTNLNGNLEGEVYKSPVWLLFSGNTLSFTEMKIRRVA